MQNHIGLTSPWKYLGPIQLSCRASILEKPVGRPIFDIGRVKNEYCILDFNRRLLSLGFGCCWNGFWFPFTSRVRALGTGIHFRFRCPLQYHHWHYSFVGLGSLDWAPAALRVSTDYAWPVGDAPHAHQSPGTIQCLFLLIWHGMLPGSHRTTKKEKLRL